MKNRNFIDFRHFCCYRGSYRYQMRQGRYYRWLGWTRPTLILSGRYAGFVWDSTSTATMRRDFQGHYYCCVKSVEYCDLFHELRPVVTDSNYTAPPEPGGDHTNMNKLTGFEVHVADSYGDLSEILSTTLLRVWDQDRCRQMDVCSHTNNQCYSGTESLDRISIWKVRVSLQWRKSVQRKR